MKKIFTVVLTAISALVLITGCSPQKKINRAKQIVLLDPTARHEVFLKELQFFPCANDSTSVLIPGGIDSATLKGYYDFINGGSTLIYTDSNVIGKPIGTTTPGNIVYLPYYSEDGRSQIQIFDGGVTELMRISKEGKITFGSESARKLYEFGYKQGVKDYIKKHPPRFPDTLKTSIKDKQYIKVLEADLAREKEEKAVLKGIVDTQEKEIDKKDKKITGWIWLFIGAVVLLILILILALIGKIKKVFP